MGLVSQVVPADELLEALLRGRRAHHRVEPSGDRAHEAEPVGEPRRGQPVAAHEPGRRAAALRAHAHRQLRRSHEGTAREARAGLPRYARLTREGKHHASGTAAVDLAHHVLRRRSRQLGPLRRPRPGRGRRRRRPGRRVRPRGVRREPRGVRATRSSVVRRAASSPPAPTGSGSSRSPRSRSSPASRAQIRLGTNILLAALRRPVVLAKTAATLDVLSGGRLDLGVGVGWQREEYDAAGLDFDGRGALLDETLAVCQTLWREQRATLDGNALKFDGIHQMPKPAQPGGVPIWVSGTVNRRCSGGSRGSAAGGSRGAGPPASSPTAIPRVRSALEARRPRPVGPPHRRLPPGGARRRREARSRAIDGGASLRSSTSVSPTSAEGCRSRTASTRRPSTCRRSWARSAVPSGGHSRAAAMTSVLPHRALGGSGIDVSVLSLGSFMTFEHISKEAGISVMRAARESGIDFLDDARYNDRTGTAPIPTGYSEVLFGELFRESGWRREDAVVANKLWLEFWPRGEPGRRARRVARAYGLRLPRSRLLRVTAGRSRARGPRRRRRRARRVGQGALVGRPQLVSVACCDDACTLAREQGVELPSRRATAVQPRAALARSRTKRWSPRSTSAASAWSRRRCSPEAYSPGKYRGGDRQGPVDTSRRRAAARTGDAGSRGARRARRRAGQHSAALAVAFALSNPSVASVLFGATSAEQVEQNVQRPRRPRRRQRRTARRAP